MVSLATYDKNNENFTKVENQLLQIYDQLRFNPKDPTNLTKKEQLDLATRIAPVGSVASVGAGISKKVAGISAGQLAKLGVAVVGINAVFGVMQQKFGQEWNKLLSSVGLSAGQLDISSREFLYTTPIENPETGELYFVDPDGKLVIEGMRKANIGEEDIKLKLQQLDALKADNARIAEAYNQEILGTDFKRLSETPKKALARSERLQDVKEEQLVREDISAQKRAEEETAKTQQQQGFLTEDFRKQTGGPANEADLQKEAAQGNTTAEELLTLLRTQPPNPLSPPSGSAVTPEQEALGKQKSAEREKLQPQISREPDFSKIPDEEKKRILTQKRARGGL